MATSSDAASGLVQSSLSVGDGLQGLLQAAADASASGRSVDGNAEAGASITQAVAGLDSPISVGDQADLTVVQSALASASATTVSGPLASASAQFDAAPGSPPSGVFGGLIDTAATAVDFSVGSGARLAVSVDEQAAATATNVSGGSQASASLPSADGLLGISASIGSEGQVQVQVDADLSASAATVGVNAASGDAAAASTADRVAAITADTPFSSDPSTLAFGGAGLVRATAGSAADPVSLSATASSVRTAADASTASTLVAGISDQASTAGQILAGGPLTVTSGAALSQRAVASSVAAAAQASGQGDGIFGMQLGSLSSGASTQLDGSALASVETVATSQTGAATSSASLNVVQGGVFSSLTAAQDALLRGSAEASLSARASNVGGAAAPASAAAENSGWVAGLESSSTLAVGADATIEAIGALHGQAHADSVAGEAVAAAASNQADVRGFTNVSSFDPITIGGSAALSGSASASLTAQAQSGAATRAETGGIVGSALDRLGIVGLELAGLELSIAEDTTLRGRADLSQAARALSVEGDALAAAFSDRTIAIHANSPVSVGGDATLDVNSTLNTSVQAATVQGASRGELVSTTQAALYKDPPPISVPAAPITVGGALQIHAASSATSQARSSSVDAGSTASTARVDHDDVSAVNLAGAAVAAGRGASLQAAASSSQQALASNVGSAGSSAAVLANVAASDQIGAVQGISLNVGGDLAPSTLSAQLTAEAQSRNGVASGPSTARAGADPSGSGTLVRGLFETDLHVGGDTGGAAGLQSLASSSLRADAAAVVGPAVALAGNGGAQLIGIGSSDLSVGGRAVLRSQADGQLQAGAISVREDATAAGQQSAFGWQQGTISAGETGQVRLLAGLSHSVLARSVLGDSVSSVQSTSVAADDAAFGFGSSADLHFDSRSLAQGTAQSVAGSV